MNAAILAAFWGHWRRSPLQLITLVAGLALATALWTGVQAINAEARASYDAAAAVLGEGRYERLERGDGGPMPEATYVALRRAGWLVSPVIDGRLNGVRIVGVDPLTAPGGLAVAEMVAGLDVTEYVDGAGEIFGRADALARLGEVAPRKVETTDTAPMTAVGDLSVARELLAPRGQFTRLIVLPEQPLGRPPLDEVAPDLVRVAPSTEADLGQLTDSFHLNLTAFGFLSFTVGLFIVHGAIGLALEQRRPVIRTLRALGVPMRRLVALMVVELALLALVSGAIGVVLGYLVAVALLPDVAASLGGLYGAAVSGSVQVRPAWWVSGFAIALLGTALAGGGGLRQIAAMPLLASARPRAWAMQGGGLRRMQALAALALLAAAAGLALVAEGLVAGFALLAALLLGAALALAPLLDLVLRAMASAARRATAGWFWADTRQQVPGLSLALTALLLAMAANVGVTTMVSSFRLTFTEFLDQRLFSDLYVTAADAEEARELEEILARRGGTVLPLIRADLTIEGYPARVYGVRPDDSYRENRRLLRGDPAAWDAVFTGDGVIVNEQIARRAGLSLGDAVPVGAGESRPLRAVVGDYGNPIGQVITGIDLFRSLHPDATTLRFGVSTDDPEALRAALVGEHGYPNAQITDQARLKQVSLDVFERTFAVTGALNVLTLAVAGFAILMSLLTLAALRLPQLAPVWALGMTRRRLGLLELIRAMILAMLTALTALPLGLLLAWVLLAHVNVAAFGWRLPMFLFPSDYLRLILFALAASFLAALWPAWRMARTPPGELLKVFTNER